MFRFRKIVSVVVLSLFLISCFSTIPVNIISGFEDIHLFSPVLAFTYQDSGIKLGSLSEGEVKSFTFDIWNDKKVVSDGKTVIVDDLRWSIIVPDFFKPYISVNPVSGVSEAPVWNKSSEKWENFDKITVSVTVDTEGMPWGAFSCDLEIDCGSSADISNGNILKVKWMQGAVLSCGNEDGDRSVTLHMGLGQKETVDFYIWNSGFGTLDYDLSKSCSYISYRAVPKPDGSGDKLVRLTYPFRSDWVESVSPVSGSSSGERDKISVTVDTSSLNMWTTENSFAWHEENKYYPSRGPIDMGTGGYECNIKIKSNGVNNGGVGSFRLIAKVHPQLEFSPKSEDLGEIRREDGKYKISFEIWNKVPGMLEWEVCDDLHFFRSLWNILTPMDDFYAYWIGYFEGEYDGIFGSTCFNVTPKSGVSMGPDDKKTVTITFDPSGKVTRYGREDDTFGYPACPDYHNIPFFIKSNDPYSMNPGAGSRIDREARQAGECPTSMVYPNSFNLRYWLTDVDANESYDMLIITTKALLRKTDYSYSHYPRPKYTINDLVKAHEKYQGLKVKVVTVNDIYKNYPFSKPFWPDNGDPVKAFMVRSFIRDAYYHWGTGSDSDGRRLKYVLLAGDDNWGMEEKDWGTYKSMYGFTESAEDALWNHYYKNLMSLWIKSFSSGFDLLPGMLSSPVTYGTPLYISGTTEVPTFQIGSDLFPSESSSDSDSSSSGWTSLMVPFSDLGVESGEPVDVKISTLYPYNEEDWPEFYDDMPAADKNPRNLYVSGVSAYDESALGYDGDGNIGVDDSAMPCDSVSLGGVSGSYSESEIAHGASGWNLSTFSYQGGSCRSVNYRDQGSGGSVELSSDNSRVVGVRVSFYNSPRSGFDTFMVSVNGQEVGRFKDGTSAPPLNREATIASDWFYGCIDEKYSDPFGLDVYGVNLDPKLCVGRAPVNSPGELSDFVIKTVSYLDDSVSDDYLNVLSASEHMGLLYNYPNVLHMKKFGGGLETFSYPWLKLAVDGAGVGVHWFWDSDDRENNRDLSPDGIISDYETVGIPSSKFDIVEFHDSYPDIGGYRAARLNWQYEDVVGLINSGVGIINHIGHATRPVSGHDGWTPWYNPRDPYRLLRFPNGGYYINCLKNTDTYPFIFSTGCYGGQFDNPSARQIGELLVVDRNGAVGGVFNSMMMPEDIEESVKFDRLFWNAVFGKDNFIVGDAFNTMKKDAGFVSKELFYGLNLFGDPALEIKGARNEKPVAVIDSNYTEPLDVGESVSFSASGSYDPDGEIVSYNWSFGDDSFKSGVDVSHVFSDVGVFVVNLTVTDDRGGRGYCEYTVCVVNMSNVAPVISMPSPVNGSTDISVDIGMLSVNIVDSEGDSFDWSIKTVPDIGGSSGTAEYGGFKTCSIDSPLEYDTSYKWVVSACDSGSGREIRCVFVFNTEKNVNDGDDDDNEDDGVNSQPLVSLVNLENNSRDVSVDLSEIRFLIEDPDGDSFSWNIETVPDIGSNSDNGDVNGTKSCSVDDLDFNTTYSVFVNATDVGSGNTTSCVFSFTTESNSSDDEGDAVDVSVDIVSPVDGGFYLLNKLRFSFFKTVVIGGFDFVVNVSGSNISSVRNIGFYVGGDLVDNVSFNKSISEYVCVLDGFYFGHVALLARVFDSENEVVAVDSLEDVFIVNFGSL